jgi:anti-sigma factor RsiW
LPTSERHELEAHLATCAQCQRVLAELRSVVEALSALREIEPSRSFALTPDMVSNVERYRTVTLPASAPVLAAGSVSEPRESSVWYARQMRAVRWATVVTALLFVLVLTVDFSVNRIGGTRGSMADAPMSAAVEEPQSYSVATPASAELRVVEATPEADTAAGAAAEATPTPAAAMAQQPEAPAEPTTEAPPAALSLPTESTAAETADEDAMLSMEDQTVSVAQSDRRSMSTSQHYWRLAQLGLAMLIVWLLAAMIALPRWGPRNRRE